MGTPMNTYIVWMPHGFWTWLNWLYPRWFNSGTNLLEIIWICYMLAWDTAWGLLVKDCFLIGETTVTYTPTFWTSTSQGFLSNSACLLTFKPSYLPLAALAWELFYLAWRAGIDQCISRAKNTSIVLQTIDSFWALATMDFFELCVYLSLCCF